MRSRNAARRPAAPAEDARGGTQTAGCSRSAKSRRDERDQAKHGFHATRPRDSATAPAPASRCDRPPGPLARFLLSSRHPLGTKAEVHLLQPFRRVDRAFWRLTFMRRPSPEHRRSRRLSRRRGRRRAGPPIRKVRLTSRAAIPAHGCGSRPRSGGAMRGASAVKAASGSECSRGLPRSLRRFGLSRNERIARLRPIWVMCAVRWRPSMPGARAPSAGGSLCPEVVGRPVLRLTHPFALSSSSREPFSASDFERPLIASQTSRLSAMPAPLARPWQPSTRPIRRRARRRRIPSTGAADATRRMHQAAPESALIVIGGDDDASIVGAVEIGSTAHVASTVELAELVATIRRVAEGEDRLKDELIGRPDRSSGSSTASGSPTRRNSHRLIR